MKEEEAATRMVEHTIEHDFHVAPMSRIDQLAERRVAAKNWIYLVVIVGVVTVVGCGLKDRRGEALWSAFGQTNEQISFTTVYGRGEALCNNSSLLITIPPRDGLILLATN